MSVSEEYLEYVMDQLSFLGDVHYKKMFGGAGIYFEEIVFALVADDVLYFKVDDVNRADYEKAGMEAFRPFEDKDYVMSYYEVPIDILEDRESLQRWANRSIEAAERKDKGSSK
jgi:DNA transformation protein